MKLLEKKRDELAGEYSLTRLNHMTAESSYIAGFDACLKELEPVLKELVEALECAESALAVSTVVTHGKYTPNAFGLKEVIDALQKYKQLIGEK